MKFGHLKIDVWFLVGITKKDWQSSINGKLSRVIGDMTQMLVTFYPVTWLDSLTVNQGSEKI